MRVIWGMLFLFVYLVTSTLWTKSLMARDLPICGQSAGPSDFNSDGRVNALDLNTLIGAWGHPGITDLNQDGRTSSPDLTILLGQWQPDCEEVALDRVEIQVYSSQGGARAISTLYHPTENATFLLVSEGGQTLERVDWYLEDLSAGRPAVRLIPDEQNEVAFVSQPFPEMLSLKNLKPGGVDYYGWQYQLTAQAQINGQLIESEPIRLVIDQHQDAVGVDAAVQLKASVLQNPLRVKIEWPSMPRSNQMRVRKKQLGDRYWSAHQIIGSATEYEDTLVTEGMIYEYEVSGIDLEEPNRIPRYGYTLARVNSPLVESRGRLLLLVEESLSSKIPSALHQLEKNLMADGWSVLTKQVPRHVDSQARACRNVSGTQVCRSQAYWIKKDFILPHHTQSNPLAGIILVGRVPVPYSGSHNPDGHGNRSLPTDLYYAELDALPGASSLDWPDSAAAYASSRTLRGYEARHDNLPNDGKFDWSILPTGKIEVPVSRIDFSRLSYFFLPSESIQDAEARLIADYLNRNSEYRFLSPFRISRALISEEGNIHYSASNAWRSFSTIMPHANIIAKNSALNFVGPVRALASQFEFDYLFVSGAGNYDHVGTDFDARSISTHGLKSRFISLYGSYSLDWDSPNNLLRASLASPAEGLISFWQGSGNLSKSSSYPIHLLGGGASWGEVFKQAVNNNGRNPDNGGIPSGSITFMGIPPYWTPGSGNSGNSYNLIYSLHGDLSLRLFRISPLPDLRGHRLSSNRVALSWDAAGADVTGYQVYRAQKPVPGQGFPNFVRIYSGNSLSFTDHSAPTSSVYYRVIPIGRYQGLSGTFMDSGQGRVIEIP